MIQTILVPVGAVGVTGLLVMFLGNVCMPHLGALVTLFFCLFIAVFLYWCILLSLRNFQEQELIGIPGGRLIGAIAKMFHLV